MKLIGMLDSPFVRRTAICMKLLGLEFEHQSLSVFRTYDEFRRINPVVKSPTLLLDDGQCLMDSTLILDYAETLANPRKTLMPRDPAARLHELKLIGLALAASEKSVQLVYEQKQRPADKQYEPWAARVSEQLHAAYAVLEKDITSRPLPTDPSRFSQASVSIAVAWRFTQMMLPDVVAETDYPALRLFAAFAERQPVFMQTQPE